MWIFCINGVVLLCWVCFFFFVLFKGKYLNTSQFLKSHFGFVYFLMYLTQIPETSPGLSVS